MSEATKKIVHVRNGHVTAVSFDNERCQPYGDLIETSLDTAVSVGYTWPLSAEPDAPTKKAQAKATAKKAEAKAPEAAE